MKIVLAFILLGTQQVVSQEYLWPTDASKLLTSSFAEYRPRHFHAGLDIKTWGRVGYKALAVRPGYIWRILVSPYGYGRALYLKLDTGEIAVYAHLSRFSDEIEKLVWREQQKKGSYSINKYLGPRDIPVQQGDIIAYTGESGIGRPHLHFEIRSPANWPINPLSKNFRLKDTMPPRVRAISVTPLEPFSEVDMDFKPAIYTPQLLKSGEYVLNQPILCFGKIGLAISCYDRANETKNAYSVYKINFFVDNVLQFSVQYDRFSYDMTRLVDLDRDYRLIQRGYGIFQKLYRDVSNNLPFYKPDKGEAGILKSVPFPSQEQISFNCITTLTSDQERQASRSNKEKSWNREPKDGGGNFLRWGLHPFRIEVFDYNGNVSVVKGDLLVGQPPCLRLRIMQDRKGDFYLTDVFEAQARPLKNLKVYLSNDGGKNWLKVLYLKRPRPMGSFEVASDTGESKMSEFFARITQSRYGPQVLKVIAEDKLGIPSYPSFKLLENPYVGYYSSTANLRLDKEFYDDYMRLELRVDGLLREKPQLMVQQEGSQPIPVELVQKDVNIYIGVYPFIPGNDGPVTVEVYARDLSGKELLFWDQFDLVTITPEKGGKVISKDGNCWVEFPRNAVYQTLFCQILEGASENTYQHKYDIVGNSYTIKPQDVPLNRGARIYLRYPAEDPLPNKLGVYQQNKRGNWVFSDNKIDRRNRIISSHVTNFGTVTLVRDIDPPILRILRPKDGARLSQTRPLIQVYVHDKLSGIRNEKSIILRLDKNKLIAEYDPERKKVSYKVRKPLSAGEHRISVWAIDRSGNEAYVRSTFFVSSKY